MNTYCSCKDVFELLTFFLVNIFKLNIAGASFSYYSFYDIIHRQKTKQNLEMIVTDVSFNRQKKMRNENNFYNSLTAILHVRKILAASVTLNL